VEDGKRVDAVVQVTQPSDRLTGAEAIRAHVTLVIGLTLCVAAFIFEIKRALGGNSLSWAYVFEWPLLGGFAVYMWWKVLHPEREVTKKKGSRNAHGIAPEFDGMLAAWQAHQAELNQSRDIPANDREPS